MMKIISTLLFNSAVILWIRRVAAQVVIAAPLALAHGTSQEHCGIIPANNCISFSVSQGTGCAWMCNYCASQLGTNNYYFTDNVCTYQEGTGCVGNPIAGKTYTCCSVGT